MTLQTLIMIAGYEPFPYSGWGMHGRRVLAVDPGPSQTAFFADLLVAALAEKLSAQEIHDMVQDAFRNASSDALGLYFPGIDFED